MIMCLLSRSLLLSFTADRIRSLRSCRSSNSRLSNCRLFNCRSSNCRLFNCRSSNCRSSTCCSSTCRSSNCRSSDCPSLRYVGRWTNPSPKVEKTRLKRKIESSDNILMLCAELCCKCQKITESNFTAF